MANQQPYLPRNARLVGPDGLITRDWDKWLTWLAQTLNALSTTITTHGQYADPNSNVIGSPGDLYTASAGGAGATLWVKESGTNTKTGWIAK